MGTTVNNIQLNEQYYSNQVKSAETNTAALGSVYSVEQTGETASNDFDTKLQEILNKYQGININEAKELIKSICGYSDEQFEKLDDSTLNKIIQMFDAALQQVSKNGKVDNDKLKKIFDAYKIMVLQTGNTVEEATATINEFKDMTLLSFLQKGGFLPKNVKLEEISDEELETAIAKFLQEKLGAGCDLKKLTPEQIERQKKLIGRIIANTSDEEKARFGKAFLNVIAVENKCPAFDSLVSSFIKPEKLQEFLQTITPQDLEKMGMPQEDVQKFSTILNSKLDEEGMKKYRGELIQLMAQFYESNKETLASLDKKLAEARKNGVEPELTDDERALYERLSIFKRMQAGNISGAVENQNVNEGFKLEYLTECIEDLKKQGNYTDVLSLVKEYSIQNKNTLKVDVDSILNAVTNNEYNDIKSTTELKQESAKTADIGFVQRETPNQNKLNELRSTILNHESNNNALQKSVNATNVVNKHQNANIIAQISSLSSNKDKLAFLSNYFSKSVELQTKLSKYVMSATNSLPILNALPQKIRSSLAMELVQNGKLTDEEIEKLNISITEKQILHTTIQKTKSNV